MDAAGHMAEETSLNGDACPHLCKEAQLYRSQLENHAAYLTLQKGKNEQE